MEEQNIFYQSNFSTYNLSQTVNIMKEDSGLRERKYQSTEYSSQKFLTENTYEAFSLESLITYTFKLIKVHKEFMLIVVYIFLSFSMMWFEFLYGLFYSQIDIISDSFFNLFKSSAFLITALSILLSKYFNYLNFLTERIELMSALSNTVFLLIVSLYRILESLHSLSESNEHIQEGNLSDMKIMPLNFLRTFGVFKIMLDTSFLILFSDYLMHPSIQIKLQLWKKYRCWKRFEDLKTVDLKENNELIRKWNNHFENMNALLINIVCDLFSNTIFLLSLDLTNIENFEKINLLISFINMILTIFCVMPLFSSITQVLMQGKSAFFVCFFEQLEKEITLFEGVLAIQYIKYWMVSQNEMRCNMKLLVSSQIDKDELKRQIDTTVNDVGVNIDIMIDTAIAHS
jgi:Co/Zn/Cd efflux system component